mgnify:CR=1 FL=1
MDRITFTREQVEAVYNEVDRRLASDVRNGYFYNENGEFDKFEFDEYRKAMLQGVYSALMSLASNWSDVRITMIDPIEDKRYWTELGYED